MIRAIITEAGMQRDYLKGEMVKTLYFGGGTPSLIETADLVLILQSIREQFSFISDPEITLEANPDDLSLHKIRELQSAGINRLSIGIQSFSDQDLVRLNRSHNGSQAKDALRLAMENGFTNLSADLIYGIPGLSDQGWEHNVRSVLDSGITHLSCYALTQEPATAMDHQIRKGRFPALDATQAARQFELLDPWLENAGYEHYEISNFAIPGHRALHNSNYWKGVPYLGLGPSAHSFNGFSRQWNPANNQQYLSGIREGKCPFELEILTPDQQFNEYILVSLRTMEGCDLDLIASRWSKATQQNLWEKSRIYLGNGSMQQEGRMLKLTKSGWLFADRISAALFH